MGKVTKNTNFRARWKRESKEVVKLPNYQVQ
jgi:hypothetical protein